MGSIDLREYYNSGFGSIVKFNATDYDDLVAISGTAQLDDIAYVKQSQGTSWLPFTMGGTFYPAGIYRYDGANWVSDRNAIADQIDDVIHTDVAGEITAVSSKATPVGADRLLIEDSEDSDNKKSIAISDLPSGGLNATDIDTIAELNAIVTDADFLVRDDFVLISSAADLETHFPVSGGVHTLTKNVEITGTISTANKIDLKGYYFIGRNANTDILNYTGTSDAFIGADGGTIIRVTLIAGGVGARVFNLVDTVGDKNFIFRDCVIANSTDIGVIDGFNIAFCSIVNFSGNTTGIEFKDNTHTLVTNCAWLSNNSGTFEKYTGTHSVIIIQGGFVHPLLSNSATAVDVSALTAISDSAELISRVFVGDGTYVNGSFSNHWQVESNGLNTEKDDVSSATISVSTSSATTISTVNTPVKIAGTTTLTNDFRVDDDGGTSNRFKYLGKKTKTFKFSGSISMTGGNNKTYSFYLYHYDDSAASGSVITSTRVQNKIGTGSDVKAMPIDGSIVMDTNDYVEVWVENNSDSSNVTAEFMTLIGS